MTTVFFTDSRFAAHTQPGHPEHAGRLEAVYQLLEQTSVLEDLQRIEAQPASDAQLLAVHTQPYLDLLAKTAQLPHAAMLGLDTYIVPQSYELARLAVGGVIAIVEAVVRGTADNGMACVRPPGHHATPTMGMGFCLLSNIAIAARHALAVGGLERIAIVDFDVHHGNGTQDALYDEPKVLFISSHQSPLYPGTGAMTEIGSGAGRGFTANIPLPPFTGDSGIQQVYDEFVAAMLTRYQPQLILVSAGFDAHWRDPLAQLQLSLEGYAHLTRGLMRAAHNLCGGKIVFVMEGGYDLTALSHGWLNIAYALLERDEISDPLGSAAEERPLPDGFLDRLREIHGLI